MCYDLKEMDRIEDLRILNENASMDEKSTLTNTGKAITGGMSGTGMVIGGAAGGFPGMAVGFGLGGLFGLVLGYVETDCETGYSTAALVSLEIG